MIYPFSMEYVLAETLRHMQRSVDISTQKTIARLPDFKEQPEKLEEAMSTLANLNRLTSVLNALKENNKAIFGDKK